MKRRTNPIKKSGTSPYQRHEKREHQYPEWVRNRGAPPPEIQRELRAARLAVGAKN